MAAVRPGPILDRRTLNRTLLLRQQLLDRVDADPLDQVARLVALQAQEPLDPYVGLWSRLRGFDPAVVAGAIEDRRLVRLGLMRTTLHLATADDALVLYPVMADVLRRAFASSPFRKALDGVDVDALVTAARDVLVAEPCTPTELGQRLAVRWPDRDRTSLAYAARFLLPLVQVPPRAVWGRTGRPTNTVLDAWLDRPLGPDDAEARAAIVRRYLAAFGPATVADIRTWSWLTGLRASVERLGPGLRTYRDAAGRELLDVEDGVIADADEPAPIRFLPQYDNLFLSHADRSRINGAMSWGLDFAWKGPVLIDGGITAAWRIRRAGGVATMTVELGRTLTAAERTDLEQEAEALATFLDGAVPGSRGRRELIIVEPPG